MSERVVIIGGGVAGLACAQTLQEHNREYIVLEASDRPGGRVQTDVVDGYRLDHGFQVLQTGYPELTPFLDLEDLRLQSFPSGVLVRYNNTFNTFADPRKYPINIGSTIKAPFGSLMDTFRLLKLVRRITSRSFEELFEEQEEPAIDYLQRLGFSERFINTFFLPFFAGACLERKLTASSRVMNYLIRVFAGGDATLPEFGMAEIPQQLITALPPAAIRCNSRVVRISGSTVTLESGELLEASKIVVATEECSAAQLVKSNKVRKSIGETCLYFSTDWIPPHQNPFLILNGDEPGPINNVAFPSLISSRYAPAGRTLVAAIVLDTEMREGDDLERSVRNQCKNWYGNVVDTWEHIRSYHIEHALPEQTPPTHSPYKKPEQSNSHLQICGEYQRIPGLQWSLISGRLAAQNIVQDRR